MLHMTRIHDAEAVLRQRRSWALSLVTALALAGATPALAQNAPAAPAATPGASAPGAKDAKAAKPEPAKIPAVVLSGLLTGTPEALLTLRQYLASVGGNPDDVARYALSVVQQLKDSNLARDPALIIAAAERVSSAVRETLSSIKVTQLKIDRNFRPGAGVRAFDFAPADAKARPGFEKVLTNDPILGGQQMQAIRRPGDDADLLADGITGVEKISVPMPDGEYRVTLMTENIGDAATSLSPFGDKIMANGKELNVSQAGPDAWLKQAVLSNRGLDGFNTATSRQGGAITITVKVTGGKLNLGFNMGADTLKTYLTGMVIEPASQPSVMTVEPEVRDQLFTRPETQARYESQIASSIADLLERTTPEAGRPEDDLAKPVQTVQKVSPN